MWTATRLSWTVFLKRQFQCGTQRRLTVGKASPCKLSWLKRRDNMNPDILVGEEDSAGEGLSSGEQLELKAQEIAEVLECDPDTLKRTLEFYPDVVSKPLSQLLWSARILKMRYPVERILEFPSALNLSWRLLENRRRVFDEVNARHKEPLVSILMFDRMVNETLFELNRRKIISVKDLLPTILSSIENCPPRLRERLSEKLESPAVLALTLQEYRRVIIQAYLQDRIGRPIPKPIVKMLQNQSLALMSCRVNILLNELELEPEFLISQPGLLIVNTYNLQEITERVKGEAQNYLPLKHMAMMNPKLLAVSARKLCDAGKLLSLPSGEETHSASFTGVFNNNPDMMAEHFAPNDKIFSSDFNDGEPASMRFLHYQDILRRVDHIVRGSKLRTTPDPDLKMLNSYHRSPVGHVVDRLSHMLEADPEQKARLKRVIQSSQMKKLSLIELCVESCKFLLIEGILTNTQILRNPSICCWDQTTLRRGWNMFPKDVYMQALGPEWKQHPLLAEMLLYEMKNNGLSNVPLLEPDESQQEATTIEAGLEFRYDEEFGDDEDEIGRDEYRDHPADSEQSSAELERKHLESSFD